MRYPIEHYFFLTFHIGWMLFNIFGWMHPFTRKISYYTILLTWISWIGGGLFYGWGYCFLTDWHYSILIASGFSDLPDSFIEFLLWKLNIHYFSPKIIEILTLGVFILISCGAFCMYINTAKKRKNGQ